MKKLLISLFALGYIMNITAATSNELVLKSRDGGNFTKNPQNALKRQAPATRAIEEDGNWFGYCYEPDGRSLGGITNTIIEPVMEIPAELAQLWKGAQITAVNIGFGQTSSMEVNIYITKDLNGETELMQEAKIEEAYSWNKIKLDTPYTIDGDAFYIGYQAYMLTAADYPVLVDGIKSTFPYGGLYGLFGGQEEDGYFWFGDLYGSPCLRVEVSGGNMPLFGAMLDTLYLDTFSSVGQPFQVAFSVVNTGLTSIAGVDLTCKLNGKVVEPEDVLILGEESSNAGQVPDDQLANDRIPFGTPGFIMLNGITSSESGIIPVEVSVTKLIGPDGKSVDSNLTFTTEIPIYSVLYPKNMLVEEYTGTWCGWCPRGIVGMQYMEEKYGDKGFIGIAVHYGDDMEAPSYSELGAYYYSTAGFPTCEVNRSGSPFDPNVDNFQSYYDSLDEVGSPVKVDLVAEYDESKNVLRAKSTTEFAFDQSDANYNLAFVITENNVGPYLQTNYFSNGKYGYTLEGWTDKPETVPYFFNEVARFISGTGGIQNSVPLQITAETPYDFTVELPLDNVNNVEKCTVIVMVLDGDSGEVMNSAKCAIDPAAGIESLESEPKDGIYRAYNMQGVKMLETTNAEDINNLPKGFYIVNGKKVAVK